MVGLTVLAIASGCAGQTESKSVSNSEDASSTPMNDSAHPGAVDDIVIEVRRDPGCGCCNSWVEYLQAHGADVVVSDDADRASFRAANGVPDAAASCHTAMVDGYAVEGHVPIEAIERLLADRPDAAGLALPGMPADSPGMGGDEADWALLSVVVVGNDGTLAAYQY